MLAFVDIGMIERNEGKYLALQNPCDTFNVDLGIIRRKHGGLRKATEKYLINQSEYSNTYKGEGFQVSEGDLDCVQRDITTKAETLFVAKYT